MFEASQKQIEFVSIWATINNLTLHAKMQENPFCGIDLQQKAGQEEIKDALRQPIDLAYS